MPFCRLISTIFSKIVFTNNGAEAKLTAHRKHQKLWLAHQRTADGEHLLFAAGKRPGNLAHTFFQSRKQNEYLRQFLSDGGFIAPQIRAHLQVFHHRQVRKNHATLRHLRQAAPHNRMYAHRPTMFLSRRSNDFRRFGFKQPRDGAQRGTLARAIAPDERDDAARLHGQRDSMQRDDRAVADRQIFNFQHFSVLLPNRPLLLLHLL